MGLDYVDIYYHHRPDPETPIEETARALDGIVRSGKAIYVGISNYNKEQTIEIAKLFKEMGTPFIINQSHIDRLGGIMCFKRTGLSIAKIRQF